MSFKHKLSGLTLGISAAAFMTGAMVSSNALAAEKSSLAGAPGISVASCRPDNTG